MNILINLNVRISDGVCVHYCVLSPFSQRGTTLETSCLLPSVTNITI